ncbi:MAG: cell division protein ZapA [Candidatus Babeliaceae bacterium]
MNVLKKYNVTFFGQNYPLVTDEEETYFLSCVEQVNSLMHGIAQKGNQGDIKKVAILTALQIALQLKKNERSSENSQTRVQKLIQTIDQVLVFNH